MVYIFCIDFRQMSAQTVFSALDYLNRWIRARAHSLAVKTQLLSAKNRFGSSSTGIKAFRGCTDCPLKHD